MRDLLVTLFVFGSLPAAFRNPFIGLLVFTWLAYMRAQDLCWGFARTMRFSYIVGIVMIVGYLANEKERPFFRRDFRTYTMLLLVVLVGLSMVFGYRQDAFVWERYLEFDKIILIALLTTGLTDSRRRLEILTWTIALSLGFFGFKGGLFGLLHGGAPILQGPGGMMEDNNDFALALTMGIPLLFYLGSLQERKWLRLGLFGSVVLTAVTILLTHSRGGFLAMTSVFLVIAWRSRHRWKSFGLGLLVIPLFFLLTPRHVLERIASIERYQQDSSAMGRLQAWKAALRMVLIHPVFGVGMRSFQEAWEESPQVWGDTGPPPQGGRVAHNSYLQIWAESGTPAFLCFLALILSSFFALRRIRNRASAGRAPPWTADYAKMFEASFVGFVVGATFLNRAHFDLFYQMVGMVTVLEYLALKKEVRAEEKEENAPLPREEREGPRVLPSWPEPPAPAGGFPAP